MTHEEQIAAYTTRLARHDWSYSMSDDYTVYAKGDAEYQALCKLRKALDEDRAIWDRYAPKS